mmetsp:Transcript_5039/g.7645  ORF Transcript_5039/g.7645 Transcript_5039/m.7645 type:complete len:80 (-) Transcript_5039:364-603(-)
MEGMIIKCLKPVLQKVATPPPTTHIISKLQSFSQEFLFSFFLIHIITFLASLSFFHLFDRVFVVLVLVMHNKIQKSMKM